MPSFAYVGVGNSTNKKDAEKNAARDFVSYLVRTNVLNADQVPVEVAELPTGLPPQSSSGPTGQQQQQHSVFNVKKFAKTVDGKHK